MISFYYWHKKYFFEKITRQIQVGLSPSAKFRPPKECTISLNDIILCSYEIKIMWSAWKCPPAPTHKLTLTGTPLYPCLQTAVKFSPRTFITRKYFIFFNIGASLYGLHCFIYNLNSCLDLKLSLGNKPGLVNNLRMQFNA